MNVHNTQFPAASTASEQTLIGWTQAIYALHAFSLLTGIIGAATVVGAFLTGWPSLIAVILNYVKRSEARGTWLESHFRWQIRTFWFGLLWVALCSSWWPRSASACSSPGCLSPSSGCGSSTASCAAG